ncbi:copper resistance CopC/CopD family protein [Kitasatospora sp. NPDC059327]|uniref:copper resistance CopC/CopD family protein n=1 Tax=Kitasatospora sp. NPDC059327 TaxID=3346803 RepID=UPI003698123D
MPRWRSLLLVLVCVLGAVWAGPAQPAAAHAQLVSTTPGNGARLPVAPTELALRFSESVTTVDGGIQLVGGHGPVALAAPARVDPAIPQQVDIPVPAGLGPGAYTVVWRVVSGDSHPIHGAFAFAVGDADVGPLPEAGARTDTDGALAAVFALFRWLGYLSTGLLIGGAGFLLLCWPAGRARPRVRRILGGAWLAALLSALGVLLLQGPYASGGGLAGSVDPGLLGATLRTTYGHSVLARLVLLVLVAALGRWLLRRPDRVAPRSLPAAAAVLLPVAGLPSTWRGTGHANVAPGPLAPVADALHLTAMALWLGGLVFLLLCVLRRTAPVAADEAGAVLRRFARVAAGSVLVLTLTGFYRAWREVGSVAALTGTTYGTLLVFKLAVLGVLLWLGATSRSVVRRRFGRTAGGSGGRGHEPARRLLRWSLGTEIALVAVVLALTSVLVATPPGARPEAAQPSVRTVELTIRQGDRATVLLDRARSGASTLTVSLRTAGGAPWEVAEASVALELPGAGISALPVELTPQGPGDYASRALILPMAGRWKVSLTVRWSDIDQETVGGELLVG